MSTLGHNYFICYSRIDSEFTLKLASDLQSHGVSIWMDQISIEAGSNWDEAVELGLESCDSILLILSPSAIASPNVRDEWSYGLEEGKTIIPIMRQDCNVPFRLKRRQHIDFTGEYATGYSELAAILNSGELEPAAHDGISQQEKPGKSSPASLAAMSEPKPGTKPLPAAETREPSAREHVTAKANDEIDTQGDLRKTKVASAAEEKTLSEPPEATGSTVKPAWLLGIILILGWVILSLFLSLSLTT